MKHWKNYCNQVNNSSWEYPDMDLIKNLLARQAIEYGLTFSGGFRGGQCDLTHKQFSSKIVRLGGKKIFYSQGDDAMSIFYWDDAVCRIISGEDDDDGASFTWASNNPALTKKLRRLENLIKPRVTSDGKVFVLVPSPMGGLTTESIGIAASDLQEENYNPDTIAGYKRVVADLKSDNPLGRLSIFDGPPGTGKTYLIRALLADLPDVKFLLLPSNMTEELAGPTLLSTLLSESRRVNSSPPQKPATAKGKLRKARKTIKQKMEAPPPPEEKHVPVVLVIEDADRCLVSRDRSNVSAISSILNLSDGIIGNLLDLRIIATTNADIEEMDSALMRSGRLSERIEVNSLPVEKAKELYAKLGGTTLQEWNKKFYPLADVYAMSKGIDPEAPQLNGQNKKKRKVGFTT